MKAFTVCQPYAYAIVAGLKGYETRPRRTHIRGRVAVHAGKAGLNRATRALSAREFWELLGAVGGKDEQPLGAVVGTVEIVDCLPVEEVIDTLTPQERALGDYSPGRWAWVLENPIMFNTPVPVSGKQGWWNWDGRELCRECICQSCDLFQKNDCLEGADLCATKCKHETHTWSCPWHPDEREG